MDDEYLKGAIGTGILVFIGTWIWCIAEYGFLLGVGLGWLPSAITAFFAGLLWPFILLAVIGLILLIII